MAEFDYQNPDYIKAHPFELTEDRLKEYVDYYFALDKVTHRQAGLDRIYTNSATGFYKEAKKQLLEAQTIYKIPGGSKVALGKFITGQPYTYKGWVLLDRGPTAGDPLNHRRQNIVLNDGRICKKITIEEQTAEGNIEPTVIMSPAQKIDSLSSNWIVATDRQDAFEQLWQVNQTALNLLGHNK